MPSLFDSGTIFCIPRPPQPATRVSVKPLSPFKSPPPSRHYSVDIGAPRHSAICMTPLLSDKNGPPLLTLAHSGQFHTALASAMHRRQPSLVPSVRASVQTSQYSVSIFARPAILRRCS
jgi:hypothetical protein